MRHLVLTCLTFVLLAGTAPADDWPQWRGPQRDGLSRETGLLQSWPEAGPKQLWVSREVGLGYSGMAVVGDTLYTLGAEQDNEFLAALNVADGSVKWKVSLGPVLSNGWGDGPRSTPTVDGDHVFALSGPGQLACVTLGGELVWTKHLVDDLGGRVPNWGYTESVLVDGDKVVCTPGGNQGTLAALKRESGDVLWRSEDLTDGAQYSSVIAIDHGGIHQYVQLTQEDVFGVKADDGGLVWSSEWPGKTAVIPTPVYHDGYIYITSGYGVGCKLVKLDDQNQVSDVYFEKLMKNHHGGVVLVDGKIYGYSDGGGWLCHDFLTGELLWNERSEVGKGALTYADNRLYLQGESSGEIALIAPSPEGWQVHGRFTLDPQSEQRNPKGRIWTHPTVANGRLYLRDQELLHCYDISAR